MNSVVLEQRLDGSFPILLIVTEMRDQKRNPRVLSVVLSIVDVILGWIGEDSRIRWKKGVKDDYANNSVA